VGTVELPTELDPLAAFDTWDLEEQLRHVERILSLPCFNAPPAAARSAVRIDSGGPDRNDTLHPNLRYRSLLLSFVTWTILLAGVAALACGGALICWSIAESRDELWRLGVPTGLGGALGLLLGLTLQLSIVAEARRRLANDLAAAETQLAQLARSSAPLRTAGQAPSSL
jgi:hypothetical protein